MPSPEHQPELGIRCPCVACVIAKNRQETAERARVQRTGSIEGRAPLLGHGTRACYQRGCHRPECVEANTLYVREHGGHQERVLQPHGVGTGCYQRGCRLPECVEAYRAAHRDVSKRAYWRKKKASS